MTDRPIPFSPPMVRALLDGRKTQTRRLASSPLAKCQPGDLLWVREAFTAQTWCTDGLIVVYEASRARAGSEAKVLVPERAGAKGPKRLNIQYPPMRMHRWLSRLTLTVTELRRQRLQEISDADARAEGIRVLPLQDADDPSAWWQSEPGKHHARSPAASFRLLWKSLHGDDAWDANPEIVALTFTVERRNIDA